MKWGCGRPTLRDSRYGGRQPHFRTRNFLPGGGLAWTFACNCEGRKQLHITVIYGGGYYVQQD